jgi:hypothetical protein
MLPELAFFGDAIFPGRPSGIGKNAAADFFSV